MIKTLTYIGIINLTICSLFGLSYQKVPLSFKLPMIRFECLQIFEIHFIHFWVYFFSSKNTAGYVIHHISYWCVCYFGMSMELSLVSILITFSCYISCELECYDLLCKEIGKSTSQWNQKILLQALSNMNFKVFKFVRTYSNIIKIVILVQILCIVLLLSICMYILLSVSF